MGRHAWPASVLCGLAEFFQTFLQNAAEPGRIYTTREMKHRFFFTLFHEFSLHYIIHGKRLLLNSKVLATARGIFVTAYHWEYSRNDRNSMESIELGRNNFLLGVDDIL